MKDFPRSESDLVWNVPAKPFLVIHVQETAGTCRRIRVSWRSLICHERQFPNSILSGFDGRVGRTQRNAENSEKYLDGLQEC